MARKRGPKGTWQLVVLLIGVLLIGWLDFERGSGTGGPSASKSPLPRERPASGRYETISGCKWVNDDRNDGDSFKVRLPDGGVEVFRLYYVDAPESAFREYGRGRSNHQRIHEQALEFGISDVQAVEIGKQAKRTAHELLGHGSFTIYTAWDDPFGDHRYHAFVAPEKGPWLHEVLVDRGLARIHTKPAELPDGTSVNARKRRLREIEKQSRGSRAGAWGLAESR